MDCQIDKFDLPREITYLNCAYLGPALISSKNAGIKRINETTKPYLITQNDFFEPVEKLRLKFAKLIGCKDAERIAVNNSVSYGLANVIKQIRPKKGSNVIIPEGEFPSNVHSWRRFCRNFDIELRIIPMPKSLNQRGVKWTYSILDAIDKNTAAVAITPLHWSNGTLFNLKDIGDQCKQNNSLFIIDGTQAIGAMPFYLDELRPDAVLCAGYKWLLGPYGLSLAYYGPFFDNGIPIEENWITHNGSRDLKNLANSSPKLLEMGLRYSSGQHPSFIYASMLQVAISQLLDWGPANIQLYCKPLRDLLIEELYGIKGIHSLTNKNEFSPHLFGISFHKDVDIIKINHGLKKNKIFVSIREGLMRVSLNIYNNDEDIHKLIDCLKKILG